MNSPRGLTEDEAAAWARVAASVSRLHPANAAQHAQPAKIAVVDTTGPARRLPPASRPNQRTQPPSAPKPPRPSAGLDSHWERRLRGGSLAPDFTLDLHDHSLDAAYQRLLSGIDIAREARARVVLVIAGRERPVHAADRADARGAIRAKLLDWLASSRHASSIAAIRKAHRRHGGDGALYVILRKPG